MTDITTTTEAASAPPIDLLQGASLLLDFDGTLVELADRPDGVEVSSALRDLLGRLGERLGGRIAIISGRGAGQVRELLGMEALSVVGSHGLEFRWADGRSFVPPAPPSLDTIRAAMTRLADQWQGTVVEDKPLGAALHYRMAPGAEEASLALARELAQTHGLHLQTGKMMVELRHGGGDKGSAVRRLMEEPPMRGSMPVFIGDDDTDEPGFIAAQDLGGSGVLVGSRPTAARYRLSGPAAVLAWLARTLRA